MLHYRATILCLVLSLGFCDKHRAQIQTPEGSEASTFVNVHRCVTHSPDSSLASLCEVAPDLSKSRLMR